MRLVTLIPFLVCVFQVEKKSRPEVATSSQGFFFPAPSVAATRILLLRPISLHLILVHGCYPAAPRRPHRIQLHIVCWHEVMRVLPAPLGDGENWCCKVKNLLSA
jgi:hypothetical protein